LGERVVKLAKTEASQKLQEISDMIWIVKLTFCRENLQNPVLSDDKFPGYHFARIMENIPGT
jgi:hypothetical protein